MTEPSCHRVCWNGIKSDSKLRLTKCVTCCSDCRGHIKLNKKSYILTLWGIISIIVGSFGFVITFANSLIYNEKYLILGIILLIIAFLPWLLYGIIRSGISIHQRYKEEYLYSPASYSDLDL